MPLRRDIEIDRDAAGNRVVSGGVDLTVIEQGPVPWRSGPWRSESLKPVPEAPPSADLPYPGLTPFDLAESDRFFGRGPDVERLWRRLRQLLEAGRSDRPRVLAVVGPEGSGKSSLLRAGLMAELARWPLPDWRSPRVVLLAPSEKPVDDLATSLCRVVALSGPTEAARDLSQVLPAEELARELRRPNKDGRHEKLAAVVASVADRRSAPLVVVVDPADRVYGPQVSETGEGLGSAERWAFTDGLFHAAADPTGPLVLLLVLRGEPDRLEEVTDGIAHAETAHLLSRGAATDDQFRILALSPMDPDSLRAVVSRPAADAGRPLDTATEDLLIREGRTLGGGLGAGLGPLQVMLRQIWTDLADGRRPMETYLRLGGLRNAINWQCEQIYRGLASADQDLARDAFLSLGARGRRGRGVVLDPEGQSADRLAVLARFDEQGRGPVELTASETGVVARLRYPLVADHWRRLRDWLRVSDVGFPATEIRVSEHAPASVPAPEAADTEVDETRNGEPGDGEAGGEAPSVPKDPKGVSPEDPPKAPPPSAQLPAPPAAMPRRSRTAPLLAAGLVAALGLAGVAELQRQELANDKLVVEARLDEVLQSRSRMLAAFSAQQLARGHGETALLLALEALPGDRAPRDRPWLLEAEAALHAAVLSLEGPTVVPGDREAIRDLAFVPGGARLAVVSGAGSLTLWTLAGESEELGLGEGAIGKVAYSPDGDLLATASADGSARLWDAAGGKEPARLVGHQAAVNDISFSADGRLVVTASGDGSARVWRVEDGAQVLRLDGHEASINAARFSPDGSRALTASEDATARLWSTADGTETAVLRGHRAAIRDAVFSPDGRLIATASADGTARLWRADDGALLAVLAGHDAAVEQVSFAQDGARLVSASRDGTVRFWDVGRGREVGVLAKHKSEVMGIGVGPGGARLASAAADGTIEVVPLYPREELLQRARGLVSRDLTTEERHRFFLSPTGE